MKFNSIFVALLLSILCVNAYAAKVLCEYDTLKMESIYKLNNELSKQQVNSISAPVFYDYTVLGEKKYGVCVSIN